MGYVNNLYAYHKASRRFLLLGAATLLLAACSAYGPTTIERDRMDYGNALNTSIKQQLLGNIVRLRYMDAPVFVDVSSVINQYSLSGDINGNIGINNSMLGGDAATVGAGGRWEDRPTITYSPISGKKFSESLLTPIPPESLFALVQSGWPTDLMFRLTVGAINGIEDASKGRQADPRFRELLAVWTRLRDSRTIGLKRSGGGTEEARIILYVSDHQPDEQTGRDLAFLERTLGLEAGAKEYALSYGLVPDNDLHIAVLTLSLLDIMIGLAHQVDVPAEHVAEGRAMPTFVDKGAGGPLFRVRHAKEKPEDCYVAIKDRGYWFYIDDRDIVAKRTFGVVQILLSLTDADDTSRGPVVSIGR